MAWINYADLEKHFTSSKGQAALMNTEEGQSILRRQANRLKQCLIDQVNEYYSSYSPVEYTRTYGLRDSIEVDQAIKVTENEISIDVGFFGDGADSPSLFNSGEYGYTPHLIGHGWKVSQGWHKDIYRFGYYEGFGDFIQLALDEWSKGNTEGVSVLKKYDAY